MKPQRLKEALAEHLSTDEQEQVVSSYDTIGDLIIVDIPEALKHKEQLIGQTLLDMHKNIKVVAKKVGTHYGRYRRQRLRILAGQRRKTARYKENGVEMFVNYEDAYFSPRLSTDRLRIARCVEEGENVLVMFSGVAPYCLVIAKHSKAKSIHGVELNPKAHMLAQKNVTLNKFKNIHLHCGDVNVIVPTLGKFNRILMCLPKNNFGYLALALRACKKGGIIDYYAFWHVNEFEEETQTLLETTKALGYQVYIADITKCGDHKPRVHRVCVEMRIE